jgi:DnaJ family protein A protein 5
LPIALDIHRYDSHRDQILRSGERHQAGGGADFTPGHRPDDEPDLYQFFTAACFSGFGDGPKVGSCPVLQMVG